MLIRRVHTWILLVLNWICYVCECVCIIIITNGKLKMLVIMTITANDYHLVRRYFQMLQHAFCKHCQCSTNKTEYTKQKHSTQWHNIFERIMEWHSCMVELEQHPTCHKLWTAMKRILSNDQPAASTAADCSQRNFAVRPRGIEDCASPFVQRNTNETAAQPTRPHANDRRCARPRWTLETLD